MSSRNGVVSAMLARVHEALCWVAGCPAIDVLVLTGNGPTFGAGFAWAVSPRTQIVDHRVERNPAAMLETRVR